MLKSSRFLIVVALVAALATSAAMASIAIAEGGSDASAAAKKKKKKKPAFTSAQKREINKRIAAAIAKIPVPAPTVAYSATNGAKVSLDSDVDEYKEVASKALPAGKYVVHGNIRGFYLTDGGTDEAQMQCRSYINGTTEVDVNQANSAADVFLLVVAGANLNVPVNFNLDLPAASTISTKCSAGYDSPGAAEGVFVDAGRAKVTAISVASFG